MRKSRERRQGGGPARPLGVYDAELVKQNQNSSKMSPNTHVKDPVQVQDPVGPSCLLPLMETCVRPTATFDFRYLSTESSQRRGTS